MNNIPYENESVLECDRTPHPVRENESTIYLFIKIVELKFLMDMA